MTWLAATEYVTNDHGYVSFVIITTSSFPHSWLITGFVTKVNRMMPHVEQELLILPGHMNSSPVFSVARSSVFFVMFCRSLFALFLLVIVLSVLLFVASDYPFGIFKLSS